jgi:hypothetical protein
MASIKQLSSPKYTAEDQKALIDFVLALRKSRVQDFLKDADLSGYSGTKEDLRARIQEALDQDEITCAQLIDFLDSLAPWGKQHVFLYSGPQHDIQSWKDPDHVHGLLKRYKTAKLFNARLPLILPDKLTLSSVTHGDGKLRITAIQKREYRERVPEHDEQKEINGERIFLDAYTAHVTRTLAAFEWDLNANVAMLQITQLQRDGDYENLAEDFSQLVRSWLDLKQFGAVNLRPVIAKLHAMAQDGSAEIRPSGVDYRTLQGRSVAARSPSPKTSVFGEQVVDNALDALRKNGVAHLGNFYWLPAINQGLVSNPLTDEVHVIMVGARSRINFPTPNTEDVVRYVLQRVRALGPAAS